MVDRSVDRLEELPAGDGAPPPCLCVRAFSNHPGVAQSHEVVDANQIEQLELPLHAADPPLVSGLAVLVPAVLGVPPELAAPREAVGGGPAHEFRGSIPVQLEELRVRFDVGGFHGDEDRQVPEQCQVSPARLLSEGLPLSLQDELLECMLLLGSISVLRRPTAPGFEPVTRVLHEVSIAGADDA